MYSAPFCQWQNGQVERMGQEISKKLSFYCNNSGNDWCTLIRPAVFALNTTPCVETTGLSPHQLMYGRLPKIALDLEISPEDFEPSDKNEYSKKLFRQMKFMYQVTNDYLTANRGKKNR